MKFRELKTTEDITKAYPLLNHLRPHITRDEFYNIYNEASQESGYKFIALEEAGEFLGLMGYRILTDYVHGRHLYIDDLVIEESQRGKGLGTLLLEESKRLAKEKACKRVRLCTGINSHDAKKFYEKNNWDLRAVVYKIRV